MTPETFWHTYLDTLPEGHLHHYHPVPDAWQFGDSAAMANELARLVIKGIKTATCSRYTGGNLLDDAGLSIILGGNDQPLCLIETTEITVRSYNEVDADFAFAEGEGDRTLEFWRKAHWAFFTREAKTEGYEPSEDMLLACERFNLLYPT